MMKTGKLLLYQCLRSQGIRLYSPRSLANVSAGIQHISKCHLHTEFEKNIPYEKLQKEVRMIDKLKEKMGFKGALRHYPYTMKLSGARLYLSAAEACKYNDLFNYVNLPDSFGSWHALTSLHVWLIMSRLQSEGREGRLVRNHIMQSFIDDTQAKRKLLRKEIHQVISMDWVEQLHEQTVASLFNYDEGMLGDDKELAGSLWRSLFQLDENVTPMDLEKMIVYVRRQVLFLESVSSDDLLANGLVPFLPVDKNTVPPETIAVLRKINESALHF